MEKLCSKCNKLLPIIEFHKNKSSSDGYYSMCSKCKKEYKHKYYLTNKEYVDDRNKEYYEKTFEKYKEYRKTYNKQKTENGTNRKLRLAKKLKAVLLTHPEHKCECALCQESNIYLIEFHHIDKTTKENIWNHLAQKPWKYIEPEINKCIPLCRNCHIKQHLDIDFYNLNIKEIEDIMKTL